jgi:hypothetical protein
MYELKKIGKVFTSKSVGTGLAGPLLIKEDFTGPRSHKVEKHCTNSLINDPQRTQPIDNTDDKLRDWSAARPTASSKLKPSYVKKLIRVFPSDSGHAILLTMKDKRKWPLCSNTQYVLTSGSCHVS